MPTPTFARVAVIALAAALGVLVLAGVLSVAMLQLHRRASPQWAEFSIGPSAGRNTSIGPSRVRADGLTLRQALATAFDVHPVRVIGPAWLDGVRYSISASLPEEKSASFRSLLRQELEARLNLETHMEPRAFDAFVLNAGPSPRLERAAGSGPSVWMREADVQMQQGSMQDLANALQGILGRPVVNETDIQGSYNLQFGWTADRIGSVTAILDQQFGLRLTPANRDFDALIIDHIRREPALVLLDHLGRMTRVAPPSVRRKVARFFSVQ